MRDRDKSFSFENIDEIAVARRPASSATSDIQASGEGIFANVTDMQQLRDDAVHPDRWFLGLGCMATLFLVTTVVSRTLMSTRTVSRSSGSGVMAAVTAIRPG